MGNGENYVKCFHCRFAWTYAWKQKCHKCGNHLKPVPTTPKPPSGAWGGNNKQNKAKKEPCAIEALQAAAEIMAKQGKDCSEVEKQIAQLKEEGPKVEQVPVWKEMQKTGHAVTELPQTAPSQKGADCMARRREGEVGGEAH